MHINVSSGRTHKAFFVMMSQAFDHSVVIALTVVFMLPSIFLFEGSYVRGIPHFGGTFWMATAALTWIMGMGFRIGALFLFGQTFGQTVLGLRYRFERRHRAHVSLALGWESLQVAIPPLWVVDFLWRAYFDELEPRYAFTYQTNSQRLGETPLA